MAILELYMNFYWKEGLRSINGDKDYLNFYSVYCGGKWSSKLQLLTIGLKDAQMLSLTQEQINPYVL
jgi:hypothetical protein